MFSNFFKFPIGQLTHPPTHPPTSKVFLDFLNFFYLHRPLVCFKNRFQTRIKTTVCTGQNVVFRRGLSVSCLTYFKYFINIIYNCYSVFDLFAYLSLTRLVTRATHVRNRVCPRVELLLKIIIILLIIFLGFIRSKPC